MTWRSFEQKVRELSSLQYNRVASKEKISGVDLDCLLKISNDQWVIVEITTENNLDKIRTDLNRIELVRRTLYNNSRIMTTCFCVCDFDPTPSMKLAGSDLHVQVLSGAEFERQFFDYKSYYNNRRKLQFGSAVNALTGKPDDSSFVPVAYEFRFAGKGQGIERISELILARKKVILLGEYGTGKSRCLKELFSFLNDKHESKGYFFCIDLRLTWGLQSGAEIVRRHLDLLGLSEKSDNIVRAYNQGLIFFLLDGFDEVGSQSWSDNPSRLRNIRFEAMRGVRELIENSGCGVIVTGREHYFDSENEMLNCLGIDDNDAEIVRCRSEFSDEEMELFLSNFPNFTLIPEWLPKRPLMCQAIAALDSENVEKLFSEETGDVLFWEEFIRILCEREARIRSALDAQTIQKVLERLARVTRSKSGDVGPISFSEIQAAFHDIVGREPVEEASVMLQRLPGLGRTGADSDDRRFIDKYILDGLRAKDAIALVEQSEPTAFGFIWNNPLSVLGQRIIAERIDSGSADEGQYLRYGDNCYHGKNRILSADIVCGLLRVNREVLDFKGAIVSEAIIDCVDLSGLEPARLQFDECLISTLIFPQRPISGVTIQNCEIQHIFGVSDKRGLPNWIINCTVKNFEKIHNVGSIKNMALSGNHRILVTIVRKIYFQKGAGRQEEALVRGLGQVDKRGITKRIIQSLLNQGMIKSFPGEHGTVYTPVQKFRSRVGKMLSELNLSTDPLWIEVRDM